MTLNSGKLLRVVGWGLLFVAAAALIACDVWANVEQHELLNRLALSKSAITRLQAEIENGERVRSRAVRVYNAICSRDGSLVRMLRVCRSREDFLVQEGPRFVWAGISDPTTRAQEQKLGVYVPYGRHWLKCSVSSQAPSEQEPDVVWEVPAGHQVFEVVFTSRAKEPLRMSLVGPGEKPLYEQPLSAIQGACDLRMNVARRRESLAYPGELALHDPSRRLLHLRPPSPTDLASIDVYRPGKRDHLYLRLWIDSDAPPCVPVIELAGRHQGLSADVYDDIFHPYDGSGRCYYRGAAGN